MFDIGSGVARKGRQGHLKPQRAPARTWMVREPAMDCRSRRISPLPGQPDERCRSTAVDFCTIGRLNVDLFRRFPHRRASRNQTTSKAITFVFLTNQESPPDPRSVRHLKQDLGFPASRSNLPRAPRPDRRGSTLARPAPKRTSCLPRTAEAPSRSRRAVLIDKIRSRQPTAL